MISSSSTTLNAHATWLNWTARARHCYRSSISSDLMDSYVDPVVMKHMTIQVTKVLANDEAMLAMSRQGNNVSDELIETSLSKPTVSTVMRLVATHARKRSRETKRTDVSFTKYPNAHDVILALEDTKSMERVMGPWKTVGHCRDQSRGTVAGSSVDGTGDGCDSERSGENSRASTVDRAQYCSLSHNNSSSSLSSLSPDLGPPALLRVTTSQVLGEQDEILRQIQAQKQQEDRLPPAASSTLRRWDSEKTRGQPVSSTAMNMESMTAIAEEMPRCATRIRRQAPIPTHSSRLLSPKLSPTGSSLLSSLSRQKHLEKGDYPVWIEDRSILFDTKKNLTVSCLGCQTALKLPPISTPTSNLVSTVVYCSGCGTLASADLMQSLVLQESFATSNPATETPFVSLRYKT